MLITPLLLCLTRFELFWQLSNVMGSTILGSLFNMVLREEYKKLQKEYKFIELDGTKPQYEIHNKIKEQVLELLNSGIVK